MAAEEKHTLLLDTIDSPSDLKKLSLDELERLAGEVRERIIGQVTKSGGHLAPSLGVVELTLALHRVFDTPRDKIIWDVGHQTYCHKLITGRRGQFDTIRSLGGISGFPRRSESPYDAFDTGHASTSISAGLGMALGKRISGEGGRVISVIGDGSLTAGLAYEGLNQAGGLDEDLIVIFNDNGMSIGPNVGALSKFVSRALSGKAYQSFRKDLEKFLSKVPAVGRELLDLARRSEESLKTFSTPGMLFEAFKFNYIGPVEGHRLDRLIDTLELVRGLSGPILVHVLTTKGKGYQPAEADPAHFHGVGALKSKAEKQAPQVPSYTQVFGQTLVDLAARDDKIVAITAAMPEGTGLTGFAQKYPGRFWDVGIAEQHAVTCAAGLACQGFKPVVAIYSTFMQRAFDQVVHDVCLMDLPVVFAMDRGGIVGQDGATHQGTLDLSFMRCVPNLGLMAPANEDELRHMLYTCLQAGRPAAVRYPRGGGLGLPLEGPPQELPWGRGELLRQGSDITLVGIGIGVSACLEAAEALAKDSISAGVINARFANPLDEELILGQAQKTGRLVTVEENVIAGGFGAAVLEALSKHGAFGVKTALVGIPNRFVEHGSQAELRALYKVDAAQVEKKARELLAAKK